MSPAADPIQPVTLWEYAALTLFIASFVFLLSYRLYPQFFASIFRFLGLHS